MNYGSGADTPGSDTPNLSSDVDTPMFYTVRAFSIQWDAPDDVDLPDTVEGIVIADDVDFDEALTDYLSDNYGYCVMGTAWEYQ